MRVSRSVNPKNAKKTGGKGPIFKTFAPGFYDYRF